MHVRIVQDDELIADLPDWQEQIPAVGDYILHPSLGVSQEVIAGSVKVRTWRTHDRPAEGSGATAFVQAAAPYVELAI